MNTAAPAPAHALKNVGFLRSGCAGSARARARAEAAAVALDVPAVGFEDGGEEKPMMHRHANAQKQTCMRRKADDASTCDCTEIHMYSTGECEHKAPFRPVSAKIKPPAPPSSMLRAGCWER